VTLKKRVFQVQTIEPRPCGNSRSWDSADWDGIRREAKTEASAEENESSRVSGARLLTTIVKSLRRGESNAVQ